MQIEQEWTRCASSERQLHNESNSDSIPVWEKISTNHPTKTTGKKEPVDWNHVKSIEFQ